MNRSTSIEARESIISQQNLEIHKLRNKCDEFTTLFYKTHELFKMISDDLDKINERLNNE